MAVQVGKKYSTGRAGVASELAAHLEHIITDFDSNRILESTNCRVKRSSNEHIFLFVFNRAREEQASHDKGFLRGSGAFFSTKYTSKELKEIEMYRQGVQYQQFQQKFFATTN